MRRWNKSGKVSKPSPVNALLLAGSAKPDTLAQATGVPIKALVPLPNGRTMLATVLMALRQCASLSHIVVVGHPSLQEACQTYGAQLVLQEGSLVDNLVAGFHALGWPECCVVTTCDIPLAPAESVEMFITAANKMGVDILYPIVSRTAMQEKFPHSHRTYATLAEGVFTGGNIMWLNGNFVRREQSTLQAVFDARKSPLRLSRLLGPTFMIRFLLKRLSLTEIEQRISRIFRCTAKALVFEYPEIAFDVDKPEDLEVVQQYLAIREGVVT